MRGQVDVQDLEIRSESNPPATPNFVEEDTVVPQEPARVKWIIDQDLSLRNVERICHI